MWTQPQHDVFAAYLSAPQDLRSVLRVVGAFQDDTWYAWTSDWLRANGWGAVLDARPRLEVRPLPWYAARPPGSLGRAYHHHLATGGIDPEALRLPPHEDERTWLRARTHEIHDIGHAITGFTTSGTDEAALLAFFASQCPARHSLALLTGILGVATARGTVDHANILEAVTRGHLLARGSVPLVVVDWESLWETPLDEVRARLGVRMERLAALD